VSFLKREKTKFGIFLIVFDGSDFDVDSWHNSVQFERVAYNFFVDYYTTGLVFLLYRLAFLFSISFRSFTLECVVGFYR
jgi:hypothetical protein